MSSVRRLSPFAIPALAVALATVAVLGQEAPLRFKWTQGEELRYRSTTESNVTMSGIPGMGDMTVTNVMSQTYLMVTDRVATDGAATVRTKFETIRMDTSSPAGSMTYDSAAATAPSDPNLAEVARTLGALVGESVTLVVAPNGAVRSVEGMAKIREKVQGTPAMAAMAGVSGLSLDALLSDDAMRGTFSQGFASLPDKAVKPGDTWTSTLVVPNPMGTQTITNTFTLKGVERIEGHEVTRIAVVQAIKTTPGGSMGPFTIEAGDATGEGEILFDHKAGRIELTTVVVTMPMAMYMSGPDGSQMTLQSLTHTKSTFGLVKR